MTAILQNEPAAVLNGICVGDVRALIAAVDQDAQAGQTRWQVKNTWRGQTQSAARIDALDNDALVAK